MSWVIVFWVAVAFITLDGAATLLKRWSERYLEAARRNLEKERAALERGRR